MNRSKDELDDRVNKLASDLASLAQNNAIWFRGLCKTRWNGF